MLSFLIFKKCVGCSFKGIFLCSKCRKVLLKKQNIRLFEIKEEDIISEISLFEFHEIKKGITIVVLYDYFKMLDFLVNNPDKRRLEGVFEILEQQLNSLFDYKNLEELVFFSRCKAPNFWNNFTYNFFKFLEKKNNIKCFYKILWKRSLKKRKQNIVIFETCLSSSIKTFVSSNAFINIKNYFQYREFSIVFIFLFQKLIEK